MRKLYNTDCKLQFIDSLPDYKNERIKKNYENLFYTISEYELQLKKDFCEMSVPEVKMVISSIGMTATASIVTTITLLRDYNNWCIANGKTNCENALLKIQAGDCDLSFFIKYKFLESPERLEEILKLAFGEDETPYETQSKLIAWLLYFGMSVTEIRHLTISDIKKFEENSVDFFGGSPYTSLILNLMHQCFELNEVKTFNSWFNKERIDYLIQSEYILRSKINKKSDTKGILSCSVIITRIREINIQYSQLTGRMLALSVDRIANSGIFYKLYQTEQSGKEVSKKMICELFDLKYKSEITIKNEVIKKVKDYQNWKKAFDL